MSHARASLLASEPVGSDESSDPAAALLKSGQDDVVHARIRCAYDKFLRASHLLELSEDTCAYAKSLALLSYSAGSLGHNDESLDAALLGTQLLESAGSPSQRAFAYNYLGVSLFWNGHFDEAATALEVAIANARDSESGSLFTPIINRSAVEIFRQLAGRHAFGTAPDARNLTEVSARFAGVGLFSDGMVHAGSPKHARFMLAWTEGMQAAWMGDIGTSRERIEECQQLDESLGFQVWAAPLIPLLQAELAYADDDLPAALLHLRSMVDRALELEHEQLARLGQLLTVTTLTKQGRLQEALEKHRTIQLREQFIRTESLTYRRRVSDWQAQLYEKRMEVALLRERSNRYQELSLQDPLTCLANRRCLEETVSSHLAPGSGRQLHVVVIDIDKFKLVNDQFSHLVGDKVLKAIGTILREHLRLQDLAARIGGDEFALALRDIDDSQAANVCDRLRHAVIMHSWQELAPGLSVSISLGWVAADDNDTLETVLARSDRRMYEDKGASQFDGLRCGA